ncbi:hypothetical protein ES703_59223 [subsurface metagenome]
MSPMIKFRSIEKGKVIYNPHFWAIIVIISVLTVIYYVWSDWFPWFRDWLLFEYRHDIIGGLFFIPFLYAALVFWWRGAIIAWSLSMAAILPEMVYILPDPTSLVRNIAFSFFPLMVVLIITLELKWREKERRISTEREEERQVYMSQIFKAQENERQRIAQELHDDTTQTLLVIANRAQTLVSGDHGETASEAREDAGWIRDAILQVSEDIRRLSLDLRPSILDNIGLTPALRWLLNRLNQENNVVTKMVVNGVERKLPSEIEVTIFRIVQEALNNIRRHSEASVAVLTLEFDPKYLKVTVQDDGKGFSLRETIDNLTTEGKLGVIGMEQRARFLGGTFDIHSELGKGTVVSIEVMV